MPLGAHTIRVCKAICALSRCYAEHACQPFVVQSIAWLRFFSCWDRNVLAVITTMHPSICCLEAVTCQLDRGTGAGPIGLICAFTDAGHSCWGILNGPATGEALAELIVTGKSKLTQIDSAAENLQCFELGHQI